MNNFVRYSLQGLVTTVAALSITSQALAELKVTEREVVVEDKFGGAYQIKQKTFDHGNGSLTLVPGQRPSELKVIHEDFCASLGGKDVTDERLLTISKDVIDAGVCEITDPVKIAEIKNSKNAVTSSALVQPETGDLVTPSYLTPSMTIVPPSGAIPANINYRVYGYIHYQSVKGGRWNGWMLIDKCSVSDTGMMPENTTGTLVMHVLCHAWEPGSYPSTLTGKIPGLQATGTGMVIAQ